MSQYVEGNIKTFTSGEALESYRRVRFDTSGNLVYSDAGEDWFGSVEEKVAITTQVGVRLLTAAGTRKLTAAGAIAVNQDVYGAADGKVSATPSGAPNGKALEAATADGDIIEVLSVPNLTIPNFPGLTYETVSDDKTLDAEDVAKAFVVDTDAKVLTLPATASGLGPMAIINGGADGAVAVNISPAAADKIMGPDIAGADDKDLINTKATAKQGDYVIISPDVAGNGWQIWALKGIWATEA